jgi:hypothetical protein
LKNWGMTSLIPQPRFMVTGEFPAEEGGSEASEVQGCDADALL